ncbi:MAG: UdgX family uracil-DNA binding protein [Alphaproteobacteria bacterium]|nr:UdgX family uracil-DNA binding protein [Alphaproteobacteria bacterium]
MTVHRITLKPGADLKGFRRAVRALIAHQVPPDAVLWAEDTAYELFGTDDLGDAAPVSLPPAVRDIIETAVCHRDPQRYALLYQLIWRVLHGEPSLLEVHSDPLIFRLHRLTKEIHRDIHKMHAFLRFREGDDGRFVAWFEPDNYIVEAVAQFFVDRFQSMAWSILTPVGSLHWDKRSLAIGPPARREDAPESDGLEPMWRSYYESTFNPARANPDLMRQHMPKKYWRNMAETQAIPDMIRSARSRVTDMIDREAQMSTKRNPQKAVEAMADQNPKSLAELNSIIAASEPLVPGATRAVLGEGPLHAEIAFVGEQPGDQEDLQGKPFVGPAGAILNKAMEEAGIDRKKAYVTNAVKHFKFTQRGKRRIHEKPTAGEVKHYRWWLQKELEFVRPKRVVALGATAVLALSGKALPVGKNRGPIQFGEWPGFITVHPSFLLRQIDDDSREREYALFVRDLKKVHALAERERRAGSVVDRDEAPSLFHRTAAE